MTENIYWIPGTKKILTLFNSHYIASEISHLQKLVKNNPDSLKKKIPLFYKIFYRPTNIFFLLQKNVISIPLHNA
jgi:hypothetical protein